MEKPTTPAAIFMKAFIEFEGHEVPLHLPLTIEVAHNVPMNCWYIAVYNAYDFEEHFQAISHYWAKEHAQKDCDELQKLYSDARARYLKAMEKLFGEGNEG